VAAGQHEIDFEYSDALRTADNAVTFKFALKAIAQQHGLYATFIAQADLRDQRLRHAHPPEPLLDRRPAHAFADPANKYGLSDLARSYMAGILAHARAMIAILAPTVNSYKRLVPGYEAPTYITWGRTNRSALIRVPMISPGKSIEGTRAEVRCPDPSSNTYLAFAVMIAAGLDGVERGLQLSEPVEESLFEMDAARVSERGIRELPGTLGEAMDELRSDPVICEALGEHVWSTTWRPSRPNGTSTAPRSPSGSWTATSRPSERPLGQARVTPVRKTPTDSPAPTDPSLSSSMSPARPELPVWSGVDAGGGAGEVVRLHEALLVDRDRACRRS